MENPLEINNPNEKMRLWTKDLVKKYKSRTVVNGVSIDVEQGEIVGLLGPNGAGKTTTFYMTVGLIKSPSTGAPSSAWGIWPRRPRFSGACPSRTTSRPSCR